MVKFLDSFFFTIAFRLLKQTTSTPTSEIAMKVRMTITTTAATTPLEESGTLSCPDGKATRKRRGEGEKGKEIWLLLCAW